MKNLTIILTTLLLTFTACTNTAETPQEETTTNLEESKTASFSSEEIASHNTEEDCYLIINENVYDVSDAIKTHPGGMDAIIQNCGTEATGIFTDIHSNKAWDMLKDYKIGTIK